MSKDGFLERLMRYLNAVRDGDLPIDAELIAAEKDAANQAILVSLAAVQGEMTNLRQRTQCAIDQYEDILAAAGMAKRIRAKLDDTGPPEPGSVPPFKEEAKEDLGPLAGIHVMVVEDNLLNRKIAQRMFVQLGADVILAANGQEAVAAFLRHQADVIFMDVEMPVLNGVDATRIIRNLEGKGDPNEPPIPIIALSANIGDTEQREYLSVGMNAVLGKPYEPDEIVEAIWEVLGKREIGQKGAKAS